MSILEGIGDGGSGGDLYVDSNRWYSEAAFVLITGRRFFLCTRGGEEMWPFARPRPGTASRGRASPTRWYTGRRGVWPLKRPRPGTASRGKSLPRVNFQI